MPVYELSSGTITAIPKTPTGYDLTGHSTMNGRISTFNDLEQNDHGASIICLFYWGKKNWAPIAPGDGKPFPIMDSEIDQGYRCFYSSKTYTLKPRTASAKDATALPQTTNGNTDTRTTVI